MPRPEKPITGDGPVAELALQLRALRDRAGLTHRELAAAANFSASVLADAAAGVRAPSEAVLKAFVTGCGADPERLLPLWEQARRQDAASRKKQRGPRARAQPAQRPATGTAGPARPREDSRTATYNRPPDPWSADTPAAYVRQLRALRAWAGQPGHKEIARSAPLPSSTMYDALNPNRTSLPGLAVVRSIVIGCGGDLEAWSAAWRRLMYEELEQEQATYQAAHQSTRRPGLRAVKAG